MSNMENEMWNVYTFKNALYVVAQAKTEHRPQQYIQVCEQRTLPFRQCLFQLAYFSKTMPSDICECIITAWLCSKSANLTCLQLRLVIHSTHLAHYETENMTKKALKCWSAQILRMQKWKNIVLSELQQLVSSIPKHLQSVVERNGDATQI